MKTLNLISIDVYLDQRFRQQLRLYSIAAALLALVLVGIAVIMNNTQASAWHNAHAQMAILTVLDAEPVRLAASVQEARRSIEFIEQMLLDVGLPEYSFAWTHYISSALPGGNEITALDYRVGHLRLAAQTQVFLSIAEHRTLLSNLTHAFTFVGFGQIEMLQGGALQYELNMGIQPSSP